MPTAVCRSPPPAPATISALPLRGEPRIARRIRLAEDVNGVAGLQIAPGEHRIGVQREIADRERADAIEHPDCKTFHRFDAPLYTAGGLRQRPAARFRGAIGKTPACKTWNLSEVSSHL